MGREITITEDDGGEIAVIDPVCKMRVVPARAAASFSWQGVNYYFCNPRCKEKFAAAPLNYLESAVAFKPQHDDTRLKAQTGATSAPDAPPAAQLKTFYLPESAFEYTCPMDPEVRQKTAGSCPKCGMALEAAISLKSDEQGSAELNDLKIRLVPSTILTAILFGITMPMMFGYQAANPAAAALPEPVNSFVQLVLASPVVLWGGQPIFRKAWSALREKQMNMFTLIAFGVSISFGVSLFQLCQHATQNGMAHMLYFESAASIITLVLFGQILELKARGKSTNALESLFALAPSKARIEFSGEWREIPVYAVKRGDRLRILPGDRVAADGVILSGESSLDESMLSGNSLPQSKSAGQRVYAGTINGDGQLVVEAESLGRDTVFAQIVDLLSRSHSSRSPIQEIADKASSIFIPLVIFVAAATFLTWSMLGGEKGMHHAVQNAVAVLVIACPCALGLATPLAVSAAVAHAARLGLLVKDARALEGLADATDMLIDKTGTLTQGRFEISAMRTTSESMKSDELLRLAASLEQASTHPLGVSLCKAATERKISLMPTTDVKNLPGLGIEGSIAAKKVRLGNGKLMRDTGITDGALPPSIHDGEGTIVYLSVDQELVGKFVLVDKLKHGANQFVEELRQLSIVPYIVSGDDKNSVSSSANQLKIPSAEQAWGLMPAAKAELVQKLKANKRTVAFLGDGVNDAAALACADAGIAMASGSDVAISSAAISVMHGDLLAVSGGVRLAKRMTAIMKQNLVLAFAYNVIALFLATGALYPSFGIELNPAIAAAAMSLSSISVILNSLRLNG